MICLWANDDGKYNRNEVRNAGFLLDESKDIRKIEREKEGSSEEVYNFVGFLTNKQGNILTVLPKNYRVNDIEVDCKKVFSCIFQHFKKNQRYYMSNKERFASNYPFHLFFEIYNYYLTYGLYIEDKIFSKPNIGGKVNWKDTISKSNKYLIENNVVLYPIYYHKKNYFSNFITYCMIFVIDYTVEKFGFFIDAESTGQEMLEFDFIEQSDLVINTLHLFRQQTFKDRELDLIDNLILFFMNFESDSGGDNYYLKHYSFYSIWEDMVRVYLDNFYKQINKKNQIVFDKIPSKRLKFRKESFYINEAKPNWFIAPDYYCEDGDKQLIFDAKYYTEIKQMDYKQISYLFILKGLKTSSGPNISKFSKTYSALILPSDERRTEVHFQLDKNYNFSDEEFIITEEYLDIREVLSYYIQSH
ncbi:hypothetical protein ABHC40_12125 [Turicibacter sanguinis]|uniref:hypothetical protein n=1 Tax=Turicibacter sanguinis TaxID=154288 RepID=UPI00325BFFEA